MRRLDSRSPDFAHAFDALVSAQRAEAQNVDAVVAAILADVAQRGDAAVREYTRRFDRVEPPSLSFSEEELAAAEAGCPAPLRAALQAAAERIAAFHQRQMPVELDFVDAAGLRLGARWTPVDSVGVYVPGGKAAYPSSVLMNIIPARVAGVARIAMCVPTPDGQVNQAVLTAARLAGATEVWRIGGAQAIAALAFGTGSLRPVDKITGPGNAYVAAAKRQVFGRVGIDSIAGPSEVLIVADESAPVDWLAADLLAQAEHDEAAQSILITDSGAVADGVAAAVEHLLTEAARAAIARASWQRHGAIIRIASLDEAPALVDRLAPEHLQLAVADPEALYRRVRHAGAVFLGRHTPEALGDYVAGPNHVLPTGGTARFSSGLNLLDFMKRTTVVGANADALAELAPAALALAEAEGLEMHARSIRLRVGAGGGSTAG